MAEVWRKSSHSGPPNGDCVEVAITDERVGVRDSKNADGPRLAFPRATWRAYIQASPPLPASMADPLAT